MVTPEGKILVGWDAVAILARLFPSTWIIGTLGQWFPFRNIAEGHLRDYLAKRADVNPEREFFLLAVLGADLPGALVIEPLESDKQSSEPQDARDNDTHDDGRLGEEPLRFSLVGVQLNSPPLWKPPAA